MPIAEHLLRGGIPAVRQALDEQNAAARAAGEPEVKADALLALAERLAPRLRAAEWLDRAEAAVAQADEVSLRDLRALVAGSDAAGRDENSRELAARLRQVLEERSSKERDAWLNEITEALDAGRVVRALRASGRPPEPGVRFPGPLAERLTEAANAAMAADVVPDRWAAVLEAVTASPVRRLVKPQGLPAGAPPELVEAARQAAERVPGLGPLVGSPTPAPPGVKRAAGPPGGRPPAGAGPIRRRPPAPPRPTPPPPPPPARAEAPEPAVSAEPSGRAEAPEPAVAGDAAAGAPAEAAITAPSTGEPEGAQPEPATAVQAEADGTPEVGAGPEAGPAEPEPSPAADETSGDHGDDAVLVEELG